MKLFEKERTFNILVVGQTQQGKSLFIKKLREIAACAGEDPNVGGASGASVTSECTVYPLTLPYCGYKLVESDSGREWLTDGFPHDEVKLLEEFGFKKNLTYELIDEDAPHIKLRLIDTPGLDDSFGRDAENIGKVLSTLSRYSTGQDPIMKHISAIMFVTKMGAYTDTMQRIFKYYQECMPNLFGGAAMMNTAFRVGEWEAAADEYEDKPLDLAGRFGIRRPRTKLMETRYEDFNRTFKFSRRHFFIDSKANKDYPFHEFLTRETIWEWLQYVAAQKEMPIKEIRLYKFPSWQAIDNVLIGWLGKARSHFQTERQRLLSLQDNSAQVQADVDEKITKYEAELVKIRERLALINVDTKVILASLNTKPISGFGAVVGRVFSSAREGQLQTTHQVKRYVVDTMPSTSGTWGRTWIDEKTMTWTGEYRIEKGYRNANLEAEAYTPSFVYYGTEIESLRQSEDHYESDLEKERRVATVLASNNPAGDTTAEISRLLKNMTHCQAVIDKLKASEVPLGDHFVDSAMSRYRLKDKTEVTTTHLVLASMAQNQEFAMTLGSMHSIFSPGSAPLDLTVKDMDALTKVLEERKDDIPDDIGQGRRQEAEGDVEEEVKEEDKEEMPQTTQQPPQQEARQRTPVEGRPPPYVPMKDPPPKSCCVIL